MIPFLCSIAMSSAESLTLGRSDVTSQVDSIWPSPDEEKWMEVGWRLDLFAARQESFNTGKPLFLWMMNGHPTGCT